MKRGEAGDGIGQRLAPARFVAFAAIFVTAALGLLVAGRAPWADALTLGFDAGAAIFLLTLVPLYRESDPEIMRRHARENDANRILVLVISVSLVLAVFAALTGELPAAAGGDLAALARLVVTIALAWLFAAAVFAMHYAHLYYTPGSDGGSGQDCGGLEFSGNAAPDFADFLYFSATLGMTFQTSDVGVAAPHMRRVALGQSLAAFAFNLGIIALMINALGGLAGSAGSERPAVAPPGRQG